MKVNITAVMPIIGGNNDLNMREGIPLYFYNHCHTFKYDSDTRGGQMACCVKTPFLGSNLDAMVLATYSPGVVTRRSIRSLCRDNSYDHIPQLRMSIISQKLVFGLVLGNNNTNVTVSTDLFINLDGKIIDINNQVQEGDKDKEG
jgi:hypothetical protein